MNAIAQKVLENWVKKKIWRGREKKRIKTGNSIPLSPMSLKLACRIQSSCIYVSMCVCVQYRLLDLDDDYCARFDIIFFHSFYFSIDSFLAWFAFHSFICHAFMAPFSVPNMRSLKMCDTMMLWIDGAFDSVIGFGALCLSCYRITSHLISSSFFPVKMSLSHSYNSFAQHLTKKNEMSTFAHFNLLKHTDAHHILKLKCEYFKNCTRKTC